MEWSTVSVFCFARKARQTPRSPSAHGPLVRGPAKRPDAPPVEAFFLPSKADPAFVASHRARQRRARQLRPVVLLREMRADHVLQPRAIERAEEPLGLPVVEMAERPRDALLQPPWVAAAPHHLAIVVSLDPQSAPPGDRLLPARARP